MMSSSRPRRTTTKIIRYEPYVTQNANEERNRGRTRSARLAQTVEERDKRSKTIDVPLGDTDSEENDEYINQLVAGIKESAEKKENSSKSSRTVFTDLKQKQKTSDETVMDYLKSFDEENERRMSFEALKSVKCEEDKLRGPVRILKGSRPKQTPHRSIIAIPPPILQSPSKPFIDLDHTIHPHLGLFATLLRATPKGEVFATVLNERVEDLKKNKVIIDLITNPEQHRRLYQSGLLLSKPPTAPPLVSDMAAFVFFVDGTSGISPKELSKDGMAPWHTDGMRPKSRKIPLDCVNGNLEARMVTRGTPQHSEYNLIEYSARLPREDRLRKKVYYILWNNELCGDAMIIYNYEAVGQPPILYDDSQIRTRSFPLMPPPISTGFTPKFKEKEAEKPLENTLEYNQHVYNEQEIHWGQAWDNTQIQPEYQFQPEPSAGNNDLTYVSFPTPSDDPIEDVHPIVKAFEPRGHLEHYEVVNYPEYADDVRLHTQYQFWYQDLESRIPNYY